MRRKGGADRFTGESFKNIVQYRFRRAEDVFLLRKGHFKIKLIKLAGRTVGAGVFVPETWGNLEITVKTGNHQ